MRLQGMKPGGGKSWGWLMLPAVLFVAQAGWSGVPSAKSADKNGPWLRLKLEDIGAPAVSASFLSVGSSMLTVHLLDDTHLLVTYSKRDLVPRLAGDPETDDDRLVGGEVVELPLGRVVAKTNWHMHDHGRYLWSLGHGRFLLRIGERLYTMAPLANLSTPEPFARKPLEAQPQIQGRPARPSLVMVSQDGGMLTLETEVAQRKQTQLGDDEGGRPKSTAVITFYRIRGEGSEADPIVVMPAGGVRSAEMFHLPIDADGYLWATESNSNEWDVKFDAFGGKVQDIARLQSSCTPRLEMLSRAEFMTLTCRGTDEQVKLSSYGLDGKETWEENITDTGAPEFAFAPAAGRFAVSHTSNTLGGVTASGMPADEPIAHQEVRVYQNASGDLLLRVECNPVFKNGENFDMSEDGMEVAVVREGSIWLYKLPPLRKQDRDDIAEVERFAPPSADGAVKLRLLTVASEAKASPVVPEQETAASASAPVAATSTKDVTGPAAVAASAAPARAKPTLLLPGEKAEFQDKGNNNGVAPQ